MYNNTYCSILLIMYHLFNTWTYEYINVNIYPYVEEVGIDPGTFGSSSQYSIHWTSLTQDAEVTICLVPFHAAFFIQ